MKYIITLTCLLLSYSNLYSQIFGNEWINYNQDYYKVKLAENKIYKVNFNDLKSAGWAVDGLNIAGFKVFNKGKEVPILIENNAIYFYGQKNDGEIDSLLWSETDKAPHNYLSYYTDTATYFITHGSSPGMRYTKVAATNLNTLTEATYYWEEQRLVFNEAWGRGYSSIDHPKMSLGEGFVSAFISYRAGSHRQETFDVSDYQTGMGVMSSIDITVKGLTERAQFDGYSQHLQLQYNRSGWKTLIDEYFNTQEVNTYKAQWDEGAINGTSLRTIIRSSSAYKDQGNQLLGFFEVLTMGINYPAQLSLNNQLVKNFRFDASTIDRVVKLNNYTAATSYKIFDPNNSLEILSEKGSTLNFKLPASSKSHFVSICSENEILSLKPKKVNLTKPTVNASTDFLIISNRLLRGSATAYEQYRSSPSGGGYDTEILYIEDLYDQHSYGVHHSIALKNFLKTLETYPKNVMIIGKGIGVQFLRTITGGSVINEDLVPVIGSPGSDLYYFTNLKPGVYLPEISLGRLSARTNKEVLDYLQKVKTYEQLNIARWRKNIAHVGGGKSVEEFERFKGYLEQYANIAKKPNTGSNIIYYGKDDPDAVSDKLTASIINTINDGVNLFTYFGHAGADVTEVDLGLPENYNNAERPTPMYFGGCILGNCYSTNPLLGEKFMASTKGALTWIASSSFSFESYVYSYTRNFYDKLANDMYGNSLGEIIGACNADLVKIRNEANESQALLTIFQGDPALNTYHPEQADYEISSGQIFITPEDVTAQNEKYTVNAIIYNRARAYADSFDVRLLLTLPNNQIIDTTQRIPSTLYSDTVSFEIANPDNLFGTFNGQIFVDANQEIDEINENNNSANFSFFLVSNGAASLFPTDYGIVNLNPVELMAQSLNLASNDNIFLFEVDTTLNFNSPYTKKSEEIRGNLIGRWQVSLLNTDTQAYYWRVRLKLGKDLYSPWTTKSFTYITNGKPGWAQVAFNQQKENQLTDIKLNDNTRAYEFSQFTSGGQFSITSNGRDFPEKNYYQFGSPAPRPTFRFMRKNYLLVSGNLTLNGMVAYAINPLTFEPFIINNGIKQANGQYEFDWMETDMLIKPAVLDSFISYLNQIPEGYHLLIYSGYYHRLGDMPDRLFRAIEQFGSKNIRKVTNNGMWLMIGTKGENRGEVREQFATRSDTLMSITTSFALFKSEGNIRSTFIGPSKKWRNLEIQSNSVEKSTKNFDEFHFSIDGISPTGDRKVLIERFVAKDLDLSFIDAKQYPYINLNLHTKDQVFFTPTQLKKWLVYYDNLPEGLLSSEVAFKFESDTIERGESIVLEIGYENISNQTIENFDIDFEIQDEERNQKFYLREKLKPLAAGESQIIKKTFSSDELSGSNRLMVRSNPNGEQPELYTFNNNFEKSFFVQNDFEKPSLDITFDGYRILNGDFVSPTPHIRIAGKDNNKYFPIDKPEMFKITLSTPDDPIGETIELDDQEAVFHPATSENKEAFIDFKPNYLEDGIYTLSVQLTDANDNKAGQVAYDVTFEVVGKSSISSFYPYPNPFSTSMRFVFTLTGSQVPDNLLVQIYTVSGKIVREIDLAEFGAIKIGHNISEFTWDGTDTYGNMLANGIYLYRVQSQINKAQIDHRQTTDNENYFKGGIGKLYILR